jgi:prepilin-type processing-associated H-X9-DG protein
LNTPGHLSYVYLGSGLSTTTATPDTIVVYEIPANATAGSNILFGDGHVEYMNAAYVAKIVAKASAGQFPVTMPSQ